ncbi:MAG: hypothetical protein FJY85_09710 [Deltaproteobacteria bacterium]|nr:hypothetical protein [Deltaproteobacteria bacterium]
MRSEALFLNGVYQRVLEKAVKVHSHFPEQILFLQPYSSQAMVVLQMSPSTVEDPMRLFISITTDLPTVRYTAEIVGWDDKRSLLAEKRSLIERLIKAFQPNEAGLHDMSSSEGGVSLNLLHVRRMLRLPNPFGVELLVKTNGRRLSQNRSTSGGWAYVRPNPMLTPLR